MNNDDRGGLSPLMTEALELLAERDHTFGEMQELNANARQTLPALASRGYARCVSPRTDRADSRWRITAAGRRQLATLAAA